MRNYELDHKLEHVYTLKAYAEVERKPVNSKNCDRILKLQNKRVHKLMKAAYEIPFYRARFEQSILACLSDFRIHRTSSSCSDLPQGVRMGHR